MLAICNFDDQAMVKKNSKHKHTSVIDIFARCPRKFCPTYGELDFFNADKVRLIFKPMTFHQSDVTRSKRRL